MKFPGWAAPWVGAAVCGGLTVRVAYASDSPINDQSARLGFVAAAVVVGFVIGCALWLRDSAASDAPPDPPAP